MRSNKRATCNNYIVIAVAKMNLPYFVLHNRFIFSLGCDVDKDDKVFSCYITTLLQSAVNGIKTVTVIVMINQITKPFFHHSTQLV